MTAGPATVKDVVDIDLPRPRRVEEIRLTPEFIELYSGSGTACAKRSRSPAREEPPVSLDTADPQSTPSRDRSRPGPRARRTARSVGVARGAARRCALVRAAARRRCGSASWEIAARTVIDPFYYSMPSRSGTLVTGSPTAPRRARSGRNIAVTLEEAVLGFVDRHGRRRRARRRCWAAARFLADVLAPFIKGANAIPRIVLASLFVIWFGLGMSSKVATAFVLVFFAVFFNAFQGAREVDKVLVDNARILGASRWDLMRTIDPAQRDLVDPRQHARGLRLRADRRDRRRVHRRRQGPGAADRPLPGQLRRRRHLRRHDRSSPSSPWSPSG